MRNMTPEESKMLAEFVRSEMADGEDFVRCSALLAELEAAHCKADRLRGTAIREADWPTYHEAHGEANGLRIAIAAVRRHSANKKLRCDEPEAQQ